MLYLSGDFDAVALVVVFVVMILGADGGPVSLRQLPESSRLLKS
jgi:hypothetical protein